MNEEKNQIEPEEEPKAETVTEPAAETTNAVTGEDVSDEQLTDSLAQLLEQAERRGYLRARNEIARAAMKKPRLWENEQRSRTEAHEAKGTMSADEVTDSLSSEFLTRIRPSVWD